MSETLYTNLTASQHEIRLIQLQPLINESTIQCDLITASLDEKPSFEALSYVWGASESNRSINLNDHIVPVTDNLYDALRRLVPAEGTRILWIDQLCINQSDIEERGQQVQLMGRIYSESRQTILWLGEEMTVKDAEISGDEIRMPKTRACSWTIVRDSSTKNRHRWVSRFEDGSENSDRPDEKDYIYQAFSLVADLANFRGLEVIPSLRTGEEVSNKTSSALWFIMHRPWWNRVWTLQECLLPRRSLLMYGPVTANFEMFVLAAVSWPHYTESGPRLERAGLEANWFQGTMARTLRHFHQTLSDVKRYQDKQQTGGGGIDLISALRSFRVREATDDRDKICGLLGLDIDWKGHEPLYPNYQLSTPQVYQNATLKLIQVSKSLKILINNFEIQRDSRKTAGKESKLDLVSLPSSASAGLQELAQQIESWKMEFKSEPYFLDAVETVFDLPSWVPDWSSPTNFEILSRFDQAELYSAARDTVAEATLVDESILALQGVEVDTVRWTSQTMLYTSGEDRSTLWEDWRVFAADATVYGTIPPGSDKALSDSLTDAFWKTLCGDTILHIGLTTPAFLRTMPHNYRDFLIWCRMEEPGLLKNTTSSQINFEPKRGRAGFEGTSNAMEAAIRAATSMRRLFVTKKGYLGLGPPQTVGREKVFVLQGGKAPFLLREDKTRRDGVETQGTCYALVGDCYVHGIMDGEAMDWGLPKTKVLLV